MHAHVYACVCVCVCVAQVPDVIECGGGWVPPALPVWDPHSCLMDYIPQTVLRLQTALDAWSQNVAIRKQVCTANSPVRS